MRLGRENWKGRKGGCVGGLDRGKEGELQSAGELVRDRIMRFLPKLKSRKGGFGIRGGWSLAWTYQRSNIYFSEKLKNNLDRYIRGYFKNNNGQKNSILIF